MDWGRLAVNSSPIGCPKRLVGEILALGVDLVLAGAFGDSLGVVNESRHPVEIEKDVDSLIVGCFAEVQDRVMVLLVYDDNANGVFGLVDGCAVGGDLKVSVGNIIDAKSADSDQLI